MSALGMTLFSCCMSLAPVLASSVEVPLLGEMQKRYLQLPRETRVAHFADAAFRSNLVYAGWHPLPVILPFRHVRGGRSVTVTDASSGRVVYLGDASGACAKVWNLEIGRSYVWSAHDEQGVQLARGEFRTEDMAPRLLKVPGVLNFRDLGGRRGLDGRRVRQGRVFRSAGLNDNAYEEFYSVDETRARLGGDAYDGLVSSGNARIAFWNDVREGRKKISFAQCFVSEAWAVTVGEDRKLAKPDVRGLLRIREGVRGDFAAEARIEIDLVASADGWCAVDVGADWFYALSVNGDRVIDRLTDGSGFDPRAERNLRMPLQVHAGTNSVVAVVRPGDLSWVFRLRLVDASCVGIGALADAAASESTLALKRCTSEVFKRRVAGKCRLDDEGRHYMTNSLGIRTDIDLRGPHETFGMTGSPLGGNVMWIPRSSAAYGNITNAFGRAAFANVFKVFLDDRNYPIDFHCIAGQDRTGTVAFILNALLGVEDEELYKDWEVTGFWNPKVSFVHKGNFDDLVAAFSVFPGGTLRERVEGFVLSLGFSDKDIALFRRLMLED